MTEHLRADVLVVGGGPAGASAAGLLAEVGWDVLLLERHARPGEKSCSEFVGPGAFPLLGRLGLAHSLGHGLGQRLKGMDVKLAGGPHYALRYGAPGAAYSIPRHALDAALLRRAQHCGAQVLMGARLESLHCEGGTVRGAAARLVDRGDVDIRANVVIGADGRHSAVRGQMGIQRWPRGAVRLGLSTRFGGVPWPEPVGHMYVGDRSYVGAAPGGDGCVVVGAALELPHGFSRADEAFWGAVRQHPELVERLQQGHQVTSVRGVSPLASSVTQVVQPGAILVGDAAGSVDPFTGEGITRALQTGFLGAHAVHLALRAGNYRPLLDYQRARQRLLAPRDQLLDVIQLCLRFPPLLKMALARFERDATIGPLLADVLGDLVPVSTLLSPKGLWQLARA